MASQIEICNIALGYLGAEPILSIGPETKSGRLCGLAWDIVRDEMLACHAWNFAIRRAALAVLAATPEFDFDYAYALPVDCLRVLVAKSEEREVQWVIEEGVLLSNFEDIEIKYISRITATGRYSSGFVSAMCARMAAQMALAMDGGNDGRFKTMMQVFDMQLSQAKLLDAKEYATTELDDSDSWLTIREYGDEATDDEWSVTYV